MKSSAHANKSMPPTLKRASDPAHSTTTKKMNGTCRSQTAPCVGLIKLFGNLLWSALLACMLLTTVGCTGEDVGHGYSRKAEFILYKGKRIDKEGAHDLDEFAVVARRELTLATNVDAASFEALSPDYSKDKNKVYYKWISGRRFRVVEIQGADPATFEVLGLALAKDKNHVWKEDRIVEGADPGTTQIFTDRVWKDARHVWFYGTVVKDADAATFEALGDDYHYRDATRVYWIFNVAKVVEGADPKTFKVRGEQALALENEVEQAHGVHQTPHPGNEE